MAGSLAFDHDLEFSAADLARVKAAYPGGPQGVFLKRVPRPGRIDSARLREGGCLPRARRAARARSLGADRGLLLLNALAFLVGALARLRGAAALGRVGRGRCRHARAPGAGCRARLPAVADAGARSTWRWRRPASSRTGASGRTSRRSCSGSRSTRSPRTWPLALPLLLAPLLSAGAGWARPLLEAARRGAVLAAVVAAGFGLGWLATGELNYQGGERKTFYDRYPFEPGVTFDSAGVWMTTDHVGPLVAGRDEHAQPDRVAPPRAAEELRRSFLLNLGYFWVGRFGGALAYFPGFVAAVLLFLLAGPARAGRVARARRPGRGLDRHDPVDPRQLVRRRRHARQPLPAGLPAARPAAAAARERAWLAAAFAAAVTAVFLAPGPAVAGPSLAAPRRARDAGAVPGAAGGADHARRPVGLHGRLAQAAALRRAPTSCGSSTTERSARRPRSTRRASGCGAASAREVVLQAPRALPGSA